VAKGSRTQYATQLSGVFVWATGINQLNQFPPSTL
jgi:hypothetical protein